MLATTARASRRSVLDLLVDREVGSRPRVGGSARPWHAARMSSCFGQLATVLLLAGALAPTQDPVPAAPAEANRVDYVREVRPLLAEFCFRCHGEQKQKGNMRLDALDPAMPTRASAEGWRVALDMMHGGEMPPDDEPQLHDAQRRLVVQWLTESLASAALRLKGEQRVVLRRLTRDQYTNALQDVLGLPIEFGQVLPADAKSELGFGNNGEVLNASPLLLEYYQEIARSALAEAIVVGERPASTRYLITFGRGLGKGHLAGTTGGYQALPLETDDFRLDLLDAAGAVLAPIEDTQKKAMERTRRRISVGLRGSAQDRFRVVDEGLMLLSALPHKEKPSESWQGPSPNVAIEMQRCWPQQGAFAMRVVASRGYVPPLRQNLLIALDERVAVASCSATGELQVGSAAIVLTAKSGDELENVQLDERGELLLAVDVPKPSKVRLAVDLPHDGFYQLDLVHRPVATAAMPSVRLSVAGRHLDHRPMASPDELERPRVVTALGAIGMRAGRHHLQLGGPFFIGFSHLVVTPMPADHALVQRLKVRDSEQNEAVAHLVPVIRAYAGTRTDDGMDYKTFGEPQEVQAPLGAPRTYEFFGRLENLPIPEPESGDTEELSGFLLLGLWNDHLVKSPKQTGPPLLVRSIEFEAPWFASWPPRSHTEIFPPAGDLALARKSEARDAYTARLLQRFVERAFRRPAEPGEVDHYLQFWKSIQDDHAVYEHGVREVLVAILCSPNFLFLAEPEGDVEPEGGATRLTDSALAVRLAAFLWNSPPDASLRELVAAGTLMAQLPAQVDRLLDDPRSSRFVRAFTYEWLRLDRHAGMTIDPDRHPDYTRFVKRDMAEETYHFVQHALQQDLSVMTLIDSDFAMLNQNLAEFYGIDGVVGPHFRPVPLAKGQQRGGLLAQGSFLAGHSNGLEPHTIKRAVWLKQRILGTPPPPPPPNVPALDPATPGFAKMTLKQQLEAHRDKASCRDCHASIDPFGVVFERFSAVGRYETRRQNLDIDARSTLPDGTEIDGMAGIVAWLLEHKRDAVTRSLIEHLFAYALGRDLSFLDAPEIDAILHGVQADGYRLRAVLRRIVQSPAFTHR